MSEGDYPKLLAPKADGQMLIWPEGRQLLRETWSNHGELRNHEGRIAGVPIGQVRRWMRRWMGHREDERPIIATGHQTELYHPGVWVKNAVISSAAERIGAEAIHFAVDTDAPKHLVYRWPGGGHPISDDRDFTKARWSGRLNAPSRAHVEMIARESREACARYGFEPDSEAFFGRMAQAAAGRTGLSEAITDAHHATDRALGLKTQILLASQIAKSTGYLLFVHDICSRADEYVKVYNAALADFRRVNGIASPGRPMPDLSLDGEFCEVPFWLDDLAEGERKRANVVRSGEAWALNVAGEEFVFERGAKDCWQNAEQLAAWLSRMKLRLSPRALTLTSFLRLAVVDQFVHGIGGAIYDQVTDRLLRQWYGIVPPAFSVGTVTLFFPAAVGRERICLRCLADEGRRMRQGALGERKKELVGQIGSAPRGSVHRTLLFSQMHRELDEAISRDPRINEHEQRFAQARQAHALDLMLFDRELPYTLQSRRRLSDVISQVSGAFR